MRTFAHTTGDITRDVIIFIYDETCEDWEHLPDGLIERVRAGIDEHIGGGVVSRSRVIDIAQAAFDLVEQECSTLHPADYRDGWSQGDELPVCEVGLNVEVNGLNASYEADVTIGGAA